MTDDRGRKRDTPDGVFGGSQPRQVPRGAGLSGALPGKPRHPDNEPTPGSVPISIQNEPRRTIHDPRAQERGGWDGGHRAPPPPREQREQPLAAPRSPGPPPPRAPTSRAVDGYAATRPAEVVGPGARGHSYDPPARGHDAGSFEPPARGPSFLDPRSPSLDPNARGQSFEPPARGPSFADPRSPSLDPSAKNTASEQRGASRGPTAGPGSSGSGRAGRPNERTGGPPPARAAEPKSTLKLQLTGDTYYEANEGRVRVPKRRGPVLLGVLIVLTMLGLGAFLWIDSHGGVENFVAALKKLGEPDSDSAVQSSVKYAEPGAGDQPGAAPGQPDQPGQQGQPGVQPGAAAPGAVPGQQPPAASAPVAQAPAAQAPAEQKPAEQAAVPQQTGQIATGEVEAPDEAPANAEPSKPVATTKPQQPTAAAEKPAKPKPAAPKKPKPVVHRDPVLKVQPLGDILNAPPPDPGGGSSLPPPDPPAPD